MNRPEIEAASVETPAECARALAEAAAQQAASFPNNGIYRANMHADVSQTFALVAIAESLERIANALENSAGRYEIGWHASDANVCHVALVDDDGRDDLFDVQLYDPEVVEANGKTARDNSLAALERLIERANR